MRALLVHIPVAQGGVCVSMVARVLALLSADGKCAISVAIKLIVIKAAAYKLGSPHIALRPLTTHVGVRHGVFR